MLPRIETEGQEKRQNSGSASLDMNSTAKCLTVTVNELAGLRCEETEFIRLPNTTNKSDKWLVVMSVNIKITSVGSF